MDYIGSKIKLNEWIFGTIESIVDENDDPFLDACCGSGAVSRYAANECYEVIANDIMKFASVIANGSIGVSDPMLVEARDHIRAIDALDPIEGFFFHNFCDESDSPRLYFTAANAGKIDAARAYLEYIPPGKLKDYLLYCGIEALSRVSNTTGVQSAFLKKFKTRALNDFRFRLEDVIRGHISGAFNEDVLTLLTDHDLKYDILYLDPPYNHRQYGPNYHLYETFVRNDDPAVNGSTGLRSWQEESKSDFCSKKACLGFLKQVIGASTAKWNFISYNSDGIMTKEDVMGTFEGCQCFEQLYRRYRSDVSETRQYNESDLVEYLFAIPGKIPGMA